MKIDSLRIQKTFKTSDNRKEENKENKKSKKRKNSSSFEDLLYEELNKS